MVEFFSWLLFCLNFARLNGQAAYDESLASRLVQFSAAVYCVDDCGNSHYDIATYWICDACAEISLSSDIVEIYTFVTSSDTEALVTYDSLNKAITVSFAGTDPSSITDWIVDLSTITIDYPACASDYWWLDDCSVHMGFYYAYMSVADDIYDTVLSLTTKYSDDNPTIEITGHSLGGAMAIHCALDLKVNHDVSIQASYVYTFGQPRVGDDQFAEFYEDEVGSDITIRVTHDQDPVPLIPMEILGFEHMAQEVWYPGSSTGSYVYCDGTGEDDSCINSNNWYNILDLNVLDHLDYLGLDYTNNLLECKTGIDLDGDGNGANVASLNGGTNSDDAQNTLLNSANNNNDDRNTNDNNNGTIITYSSSESNRLMIANGLIFVVTSFCIVFLWQ